MNQVFMPPIQSDHSDFVLGELAQTIFINEIDKCDIGALVANGRVEEVTHIGDIVAKTSFILAREFLEERARQYEAASIKATGINIDDIKFGGGK